MRLKKKSEKGLLDWFVRVVGTVGIILFIVVAGCIIAIVRVWH